MKGYGNKAAGLAMLAAAFFGFSCGDKADTTAPTFELTALTPAKTTAIVCGESADNVIPITGGQSLNFTFLATDDRALGQYKIDIHDDFDCHGHDGERTTLPNIWTLLDVVDFSGDRQTISRQLEVPADVRAGNYHFQISVLDAEGNENQNAAIYTLQILNPNDIVAPSLSFSSSVADMTLSRGSTLRLQGTAADNLALEGGQLVLSYESPSDDVVTAQTYQFGVADGSSYTFDLSFVLPNSFVTGEYHFVLRLLDAVGNTVEQEIHVTVS
jgi:hypothetical protein